MSYKYKVGDWVMIVKDIGGSFPGLLGAVKQVSMIDTSFGDGFTYRLAGNPGLRFSEEELLPTNGPGPHLITTNSISNSMQQLKPLIKRLLDPDLQKLVKAGYLTTDLQLTDKGRTAQEAIHFQADKAELVKMAEEDLKEENKV